MNVAWLDSSLSIMEQGIRDYDTLCLRFKYYTFFDLNPKYDQVRINQLYEQAKWQLLNEEIDCTEEEMLMFAALQVSVTFLARPSTMKSLNFVWFFAFFFFSISQFQISLQNDVQQPDSGIDTSSLDNGGDDDIDAALSELQITLEGPNGRSNVITEIPELQDYLRFLKYDRDADITAFRNINRLSLKIFRPKKFTLKGYKRYWFMYKDLHLLLYKTRDGYRSNEAPAVAINLRGCEVTPEVNLTQGKFNIKLEVPPDDGIGANSEMWVRCDTVSTMKHEDEIWLRMTSNKK